MKFNVKKMYNGKVEVRDYQLKECLEKNDDMVIEHDGDIMTIPFVELKTKAVSKSKLFESKIPGSKSYHLIGYDWNPDNIEL